VQNEIVGRWRARPNSASPVVFLSNHRIRHSDRSSKSARASVRSSRASPVTRHFRSAFASRRRSGSDRTGLKQRKRR
jgi:hypothetical protein